MTFISAKTYDIGEDENKSQRKNEQKRENRNEQVDKKKNLSFDYDVINYYLSLNELIYLVYFGIFSD